MQTRYIKFKDNLVSDDTNASKSGIIPGSVYRGFDQLSGASGLTFNIDHSITGEVRPNISEVDSSPMGVWVSRQGVTIKENGAIAMAIETNAGNSFYRNDYIIGRHHHDVIYPGGVVATYGIIKGPLNNDSLPAIESISGNDWVILGILRIPPNVSNATTTIFNRSRIPSLGNQFPALLDAPNRFVDQQQEFQGSAVTIVSSTINGLTDRNSISVLIKGNVFALNGTNKLDLLPSKPFGTEIELYFSQDTTIRPFVSQLAAGNILAGYSIGLRPIVINYDTTDDLLIKANQIATFRMINKGGVYSSGNRVFGDFWKLISVSDSAAVIKTLNAQLTSLTSIVSLFQAQLDGLDGPGNIRTIKIFGNILDVMDSTGRGKPDGPYPKHQWCNGLLSTPDLRDIKLSGFNGGLDTYINEDYRGSNNLTLAETNIPSVVPGIHGSMLNKPNNGGTPSQQYLKVLNTDSEIGSGQNPMSPIYGNPANPGRANDAIDLRGRRYMTIFIMRLPDDVIAANPFGG